MIRLLHTADWHLGKMIYGRSLLEDQEYFIDRQFLPAVERERPDAVLLAGDIYDRAVAPVEAIRLFDRVVSELARMGVPLVAITGNHDGGERMALGASLLREQGITIVSSLREAMRPVFLECGGERVCIHPLPYFDPPQARAFLQREDLHGFHDSMQAVLQELRKEWDTRAVHILMAHCFVTGCTSSDSERSLYVGGSGEVGASLFTAFDYAALGHLHAPQRAGEKGRYAGSPLKYSFDEARQKKGMTLVEIENKRITTRPLPIFPLRDLREISGTFEELLQAGKVSPSEDYLFANLTDGAPVYLPMEQLRAYYPNLLGLRSQWMACGQTKEREALREGAAGKDDGLIFDTFLKQICKQEVSDEDRALFESFCRQAEEGQ